jgi:hypothetical protein
LNNLSNISLVILLLILINSLPAQVPDFGNRVNMGLIEHDSINEASGLAASRKNLNVLWTHNDSGDLNRLFALDIHGKHLGIYQVASFQARDWEDIAIGPGPEEDTDYLYIGDTGDNTTSHSLYYIYRIVEPDVESNQAPKDSIIAEENIETIIYKYPDGPRDAEAVMVDPVSKDIYIISKSDSTANVYLAQYPQPIGEISTLEYVITLNIPYIVAADISISGEEILLKTYTNIFYWRRDPTGIMRQVLLTAPATVPYSIEPQGESVCWAGDNSGYFTVSEELFGIQASVYFYPRANNTTIMRMPSKPESFILKQNYPNPFNRSTVISYYLEKPGYVQIIIYDELGRLVNSLNRTVSNIGNHIEIWDGRDKNGISSPNGIYYYMLKSTNKISRLRSMVLLK